MQGVPHGTKFFFNIIAIIEYEILFFGQNYLISNIINIFETLETFVSTTVTIFHIVDEFYNGHIR